MADLYEALVLVLFLCGFFLTVIGLDALNECLCRKSVFYAGLYCWVLQFIDPSFEREIRRELVEYHRMRGNL